MVHLTVVSSERRKSNSNLAHRASATEGEAALRLLDEQGFVCKSKSNKQATFRCPFHEGPGAVEPKKSPNFYINTETGTYFCHSASCGERGNLQSLERYFGIEQDDEFVSTYQSREDQLRGFEQALKPANSDLKLKLRQPFYDHGLTDITIERFRLGFDVEKQRYVLPYLEGRRPKLFRYYKPNVGQANYDPKWKYTWEDGTESTLFNAQDAVGDKDGWVLLCEGELKAMLAVQLGYAAVAVPGAGQWKPEWQACFTHARHIAVVYDNDNPEFHIYDDPDNDRLCMKCKGKGLDRCLGHNPGQEAALARVEQLGWRAKNIVLPLPAGEKKTDINEFLMRDGLSNLDFAQLVTGKKAAPFKVQTLAEISAAPPDQAVFLVAEGILPKGGRLLIAGKPKVGKSIFADNLALSLAAGIPFLGRFGVDHPTRTLLLDRELSKWSLFSRMESLIADRRGYAAAMPNLCIDHDHLIRLDQTNAFDTLYQLVDQNGAETIILDTAYKFFGGDVESSSSLMKGFEVLDKLIHETGVSVVMTHHMRKGARATGKENTDVADADSVAGSFLWTGWPNATILLNYMNRSVENPFNSVATFTAFRDHAAPEPLALYRSRESISYSAIEDYSHEQAQADQSRTGVQSQKPTTEAVAQILLEMCPTTEDDFLHVAAARFGVSITTIKPYYLDALSGGNFEKTKGKPPILKFKYDQDVDSWEKEHGLPERPAPAGVVFEEVPMFAAGV